MTSNNTAIVLFSGGQDSTTCLYWAKSRFEKIIPLTISYGQRHAVELSQAKLIARRADVEPVFARTDSFDFVSDISALTSPSIKTSDVGAEGLPMSFVPGRNLIFLNLAALLAYREETVDIVIGVCESDYSGYPDCRAEFIADAQRVLRSAMLRDFTIHTPLMKLTKAETFGLAEDLGCLEEVIEHSHTCYEGNRVLRNEWGYGCGVCPACLLRKKGWEEYKKGGS